MTFQRQSFSKISCKQPSSAYLRAFKTSQLETKSDGDSGHGATISLISKLATADKF